MNGVGLVDEIDAVGKGSCEGEGWAQMGNLSPKSRCASDDKKAGGASKEINRDVAAWKLIDEKSDWVEAKASKAPPRTIPKANSGNRLRPQPPRTH